jgi:hypothetical protein
MDEWSVVEDDNTQEPEYVGIPGAGVSGSTRIVPASPTGEVTSDADQEPVVPGADYAVNLNRLIRGATRAPTPHAPPPPIGHNGGPPLPPTIEQAREGIGAQIGERPGKQLEIDPYTQLVDDLHPVKRAMGDAEVPTVDNPYEQMRLTRGSAGKAEHMLEHGTLQFDDLGQVGGSLKGILEPLRKSGELEDFKKYLVSRRALELESRGVNSGFDIPMASMVVNADAQRFGRAAQEMDLFQTDVLNYLRDSGILSDQAVAKMKDANSAYIPFSRIFDDPKVVTKIDKGNNVSNPLKRIKGGDAQIADPIESVINNTHTITGMAERNRAAQSLVDFATNNPDTIPIERVNPRARPTNVSADELSRAMNDLGIRHREEDVDGFTVFRKNPHEGLKDDEFAVYRGGKREVYRTIPEIASAVRGMNEEEFGIFTKMVAAPARLLRAGVTLAPDYVVANIIRDQISAAVQTHNGFRPFVDWASGMKSYLSGDEAYRDFLKSGGTQSMFVTQDRNYANKMVRKYGHKPNKLRNIGQKLATPLDILRSVSEAAEAGTRLGEFKRSTKGARDKASIMKAGMDAREVTTDFQRHGSATRQWRAMTTFGGGQLQGLDREIRNLKDRDWKGRMAVSARIATYITTPSIVMWYLNKGDPRYEQESYDIKDKFFLVPVPGVDHLTRVPKGFTTGIVSGSGPERMLDYLYKENPNAFHDFGKSLYNASVPNIMPTVAQVPLEHAMNRTAMSGYTAPLVPRRFDNIEPQEQFHPATSETAKAAGRGISKMVDDTSFASPIIIDNYIRGWGGTMAQYGNLSISAGLKALGAVPQGPEAPEKTLADIPILRRFVQRWPHGGAQPIKDFYEKNALLEKAHATRSKVLKEGGRDDDAPPVVQRVRNYATRMSQLQSLIRQLNIDKKLSAKEKRQKIDAAYLDLLNTAQLGLKAIKEHGSVVRQPTNDPWRVVD